MQTGGERSRLLSRDQGEVSSVVTSQVLKFPVPPEVTGNIINFALDIQCSDLILLNEGQLAIRYISLFKHQMEILEHTFKKKKKAFLFK